MSEGVLNTPVFRLHLVMFRVIIATADGMFQIPKWVVGNLPFFLIFTKIAMKTCFQKTRGRDSSRSSLLIRCNTHAPWRTTTIQTNGKHHHFFIRMPIYGRFLIQCVDKSHVLLVTVEPIGLLFLNIFSFNFALTPNKSLRLTRFRRSYIVLNNHCQSYAAFFCFMCTV